MLAGASTAWSQAPPPAQPQTAPSWAGRRVILKKPNVKIGYSDKEGKQVYIAELTSIAYLVTAEQEGFLQVEQRGAVGWFDKDDALLPDDAIKYFNEKVAGAKDATPLAYLGWAYREKKDCPMAIKTYDQAIAKQPAADWINNRGILHLEARDFDKAIADFTEALRLKPDFLIAMENRSLANQSANRPDQALVDLTEVMRRDPKNARHFVRRAQLYGMKADLDAAQKDYDEAVALEPRNTDTLVKRGDLFAERKQFAKAYADYALAAKLTPEDSEPLVHRSHVFVEEKKFPNALVDLDAALKLDPTNAEILIARGWVGLLTGRYRELTVADDDAAAKMEPKSPARLQLPEPGDGDLSRREVPRRQEGGGASPARRWTKPTEEGPRLPRHPRRRRRRAGPVRRGDQTFTQGSFIVAEITLEPDAAEASAHLDMYKKKMPFRQAVQK